MALTGQVASGKSAVLSILADNGFGTVDADRLAHETYASESATKDALVACFGQKIVAEDGAVSRKVLRGVAFASPVALKNLRRIVWPPTRKLVEQKLTELKNHKRTALEAADLLRADWHDLARIIWIVDGPARRDGVDDFLRHQQSAKEMVAIAQDKNLSYVVIPNKESPAELRSRVEQEIANLV